MRFNFDGISDQGKSTGDLKRTQKRRKWKHEGHHVNKVVFHKTNFFQLTLHNHHSAIVMSSVQFKIDEQRKSYTFEFQITAAKKVQQIDRSLWKNRYSIVANEVGVHRSNIERWHKKYMRGGYRNIKCSHANKTFRSKGAERPIKYPEIEEYLLKFWNSLHKDEYPLASILLQLEALDYDPLFLGGVQHPKFENRWACWCNHFMSRHNLVFRASSPAQNIPLDKDPIFIESSDFFTDTPLNG